MRDFPAANYQSFVGKRVKEIRDNDSRADEGLEIVFEDGSMLDIGFSGCEGSIEYKLKEDNRG